MGYVSRTKKGGFEVINEVMTDDDLPDYWGEIDPNWMKYHHFDDDESEYIDLDAGDYVFSRNLRF